MTPPIDWEKISSVEAANKAIKKNGITEEEAKLLMQAFSETKEKKDMPVNLTILERNKANMAKEIHEEYLQPMIDKVFKEFYNDNGTSKIGKKDMPVNLIALEKTRENMAKEIHEKYIQPLIDKEFEKAHNI